MSSVLIILAEGFEELEAVTVIDVLRRAEITVVTAGLNDGPITSARQIKITPDKTINEIEADKFDMLVLPGGQPGTDNLAKDDRVKKIVQTMHQNNKYTAAICAAPYVLSQAGILNNKTATSYPSFHDKLNAKSVDTKSAVVIDGNVVTSQGPGTALEFAFKLVEIFKGSGKAKEIAAAMLYNK
ncbi:DJ-1 family protein [Candidatus Magnetoovum chiemensis]|nr:DJ-1 family protein [Candidatus Magnetoovum chiemensis]